MAQVQQLLWSQSPWDLILPTEVGPAWAAVLTASAPLQPSRQLVLLLLLLLLGSAPAQG